MWTCLCVVRCRPFFTQNEIAPATELHERSEPTRNGVVPPLQGTGWSPVR